MTRLGAGYARLWTASTTSNLGDGLIQVGAPLVAVQLTREPLLVAGVQMAATLPWLLLALTVGAIADRRGRRNLMVGAALFRAGILAGVGIAVASGHLSLPLIYVAVLAIGIGEVLFDTSSQSLVPDLVERDHLGRANGRLIGAQVVMNNFVGAPLAGLLVGIAAATVFLGPAVLYLAAALILAGLPCRYVPPERPPATLRADIAEGLRYLRGEPTLTGIAGIAAFMNLANTAYFSVFVLFVVGPGSMMGLDAFAYGLLATGVAAGSVAGSLIASRLEARVGPRRTMLGGLLLVSLAMLIPVVTAHPIPIAAMTLVIGAGGIVVNVQLTAIALFQRHIRDEVLRADLPDDPAPDTRITVTAQADERP